MLLQQAVATAAPGSDVADFATRELQGLPPLKKE
jgi:hypothetical protein